eukprot:jgi/Undpi1/9802/HiC_scaffold_27.g12256.m1
MTDGCHDDLAGHVVIIRRAVENKQACKGPGAKSSAVVMRTGDAPTMGYSPPANSVRDRVRQMQGMTEIDRGIEALEAVAAIAASGRSSLNTLPQNVGMETAVPSRRNAGAGEDQMLLFHSTPRTAASKVRSTGRGMAALGVTASRRTSWSSAALSRSSLRASPTRSPSPHARGLVRVGSDLSTASSQEEPVDVRRDDDTPSSYSGDDPASVATAATATSPNMGAPGTIGAIFPRKHSKNGTISAPSTRSKSSPKNSRPRSAGSRGSLQAKMSPQARGFSTIMWHDSFTPPTEESVSRRRGGEQGRLKAKGGWWTRSSSLKGDEGEGDGEGEQQEGPRRAFSSPVGMRVENAQMRMENRRLEGALSAAKESAIAAEERSKELARQASLRVRQAEARRVSAEEAMKQAEAKAFTLRATVQVLKSTGDFGGPREPFRGGCFTPREVEAEVTAAYQGILQDMDMERASLLQQLDTVQKENEMLRSKTMGARNRTRSLSRTTDVEEMAAVTPLPLPPMRSFAKPKTRSVSITRDASWSDISPLARGTGEDGASGSGGGGGGICQCGGALRRSRAGGRGAEMAAARLVRRLGMRVALVQLEGLGALVAAAGDTAMHSLLLTDKALYVMETRRHGGGGSTWKDRASTAEAGGDAGNGSDSLCRLERDCVGGLSLPLEARVLPNGDEVAVRSKAVVLRLNLPGNTMSGPPSSSLAAPSSALTAPGYLWLTCESNEARGELVEHLCQWHQLRSPPPPPATPTPPPPRGHNDHDHHNHPGGDASTRTTPTATAVEPNPAAVQSATVGPAATVATAVLLAPSPDRGSGSRTGSGVTASMAAAAHASAAAAAEVAAAAAVVAAAVAAEVGGVNTNPETEGGGVLNGSYDAKEKLGAEEQGEGEEEEEEETLEVDQVLLEELLTDLGDERSLNVTALLLANTEMLAHHDVDLRS